MSKGKYVDFHSHSMRSDGKYSTDQLVQLAIENDIGVFAITDHNEIMGGEEFRRLQEKYQNKIQLVQGSEVSMIYETSKGEMKEIHVVVLFNAPDKLKFLEQRKMDRVGYVNAIKDALAKCDIWIPDYNELKKIYPETEHLGRKHIAEWMYQNGIVDSVDEVFDVYIGGFGERRAFVDSAPYRSGYGTMQETIKEILQAGDDSIIAIILAHPYYYNLETEELFRLIRKFKEAAGELAGMETLYAKYSDVQRAYLKELAGGALGEGITLMQSAGSDYHGQADTETLDNQFPMEIWEKIESNWKNRICKQKHSDIYKSSC